MSSPRSDAGTREDRGRRELRAAVLLAAVTLVGGLVLVATQRYRIGVDGVSYVTLADAWARLDVATAANAYWGPLLPVLAAPLVAEPAQRQRGADSAL